MTNKRKPKPKARATIRQKLFAIAVLVAAAAIFYYLTNRPVAHQVPSEPWKAEVGDKLIIRPLGFGRLPMPLIAVEGVDNEAVDVRFDHARLSPESLQGLRRDFNLIAPAAEGKIAWTTAAKGSGHTMVDVVLETVQGIPEIRIGHLGEGAHPGLSFTAHHATLKVHLSVLLGDDSLGITPELKTLQIAGGSTVRIPGAIPITVIVPENQEFRLTFPSKNPASFFRLGATENPKMTDPGLWLRDLGVLPTTGGEYKLYGCAASEGTHFWAWRQIRPEDCATSPTLRATKLELTSDNMEVVLNGSAWVVKNGTAETDTLYNTLIEKNPVLAAFFSLVFIAFATRVWRAFSGGDSDNTK
jgi:hypothetical protein